MIIFRRMSLLSLSFHPDEGKIYISGAHFRIDKLHNPLGEQLRLIH